jgi:WhiB family redox-sensing transcriptional regulator
MLALERMQLPTRNLDWKADAACRDLDTNLFFPSSEDDAAPALQVCASCPVRETCLEFALSTRQDDGVWGGLSEGDRRRLRRRRRTTAA